MQQATLKDKVTNVAAAVALVGTLLQLSIEAGIADAAYKKYAIFLIGAPVAITAFATGKCGDLNPPKKQ